jgi:CDP-6-deoxy-D-xylo-4-hexulose-3-dehydrase
MNFSFPLASSSWDKAEHDALQRVIDSGNFSMGEEVSKFEKKFAAFTGSRHAVMVNSGSSANLLMTAALFFVRSGALQRGDEVIVPAVSWSTTYAPLAQYGLHLKFVDIDRKTLNYDLNALERAINDKTRLIMAVNLLGNSNNYDVINALIANRNIRLVEDNCEAMGATFNGKQAGTFGLMGSFSLFFSHHISTMEGGVVVTDDEELYHIMLSVRSHGWTRNLPDRNYVTGTKSNDQFEESFRFVLPGYNLRPLEMSGAVGQAQLEKLPHLLSERRANGKLIQIALANHPLFMIQQETGKSSWFGFSLILRETAETTRKELLERLNRLGFQTRPIVSGNFTKNAVLKYYDHSIYGKLSNADYIDQNGFFVGNHHYPLTDAINELAILY